MGKSILFLHPLFLTPPSLSTLAQPRLSDTSVKKNTSLKYALANKLTAWYASMPIFINKEDLILILSSSLGVLGEASPLEANRKSLDD